ncbi:hypothetical protein PVK64_02035 [Aliivibrio sp. S4TY2]|uniref:hypothetical protein n=1 Tax=unclassified Aliivibrio TaxID=2645654 RepID=UPI002379265C|nr:MULTISPECIES: hypothetical protein [unclassified Aliivibrio]MDD9154972.1 hypothetical protein [Aliivibrio sp. S4TY2]MDD9158665.1 hypothetical protein [Aliivibrio sp. S4TY1]MDD9162975.1 hypothetical protein [Aliivibrio sp. S4MY2]MDD9166664.1 hypothetical protein [Aliivibrio sp. S4MY4]MDD9184052.1 hypothetical protein [Aliivibrio sp. S4MY3]
MSIITKAKAIMINDRYFYDFGKKGQVLTAWSFGGAKLFMGSYTMEPVLKKLDEKRKKYQVVDVVVNQPSGLPVKELYKYNSSLSRTMSNLSNIGGKIGFERAALDICQLTSGTIALAKEHPKYAAKISELVVGNKDLCFFDYYHKGEPLCVRLNSYKERKSLQNNVDFAYDVPF